MIKWKTLFNKSCRSYFIESRTVKFVFFWFFYNFILILQVHCLMHPGRQDLNVIFFTFRSYRQLDGRQAPIFENFPIRHIFLKFYFFNIKMKKAHNREGQKTGPFPLNKGVHGPYPKKEIMAHISYKDCWTILYIRSGPPKNWELVGVTNARRIQPGLPV